MALYNPTNGFAAFLIPAVLMLIIQQTLLLGIGLSAGTAREHNRFRDLVPVQRHYNGTLVPVQRHYNGTLRIVFGKGLSYLMVYALVSVYILVVVPRLFSLNQIALPGELTLFCLPYLLACIFFSMTASIGQCDTALLEILFLSLPLHVRHQWLCAHQQHGGDTERGSLRIPGLVDTDRRLFRNHLPGLPLANPDEPPTRHRGVQTV